MKLAKRALERIEPGRSRLQQDDDLLLVSDLTLPSIERPRTGKERAARDEPSLEQGTYELYGLILGSDGGEYDYGVGVHVVRFCWSVTGDQFE